MGSPTCCQPTSRRYAPHSHNAPSRLPLCSTRLASSVACLSQTAWMATARVCTGGVCAAASWGGGGADGPRVSRQRGYGTGQCRHRHTWGTRGGKVRARKCRTSCRNFTAPGHCNLEVRWSSSLNLLPLFVDSRRCSADLIVLEPGLGPILAAVMEARRVFKRLR